jgi:hypothetical protein
MEAMEALGSCYVVISWVFLSPITFPKKVNANVNVLNFFLIADASQLHQDLTSYIVATKID